MKFNQNRLLKRFAFFYFGVTFILLVVVFAFMYRYGLETQKNLAIANMKNFSFQLSSNITKSHMSGGSLNCNAYINSRYHFKLLDKNREKIMGDDINSNGLVIEDKSPLGHLGVWYIVVEDTEFNSVIKKLKVRAITHFFIAYFIIALLGYYLIKLMLKPIKEAQDRIDNFIKDTTHELNTPITALLMCANEKSLKNPKNIDRLYISAKRVSQLYKDLTYVFLEDDNSKNLKEIELKELINEQLEYFRVLASKKRITINTNLDSSKFTIDIEDFNRLISNILSNSIKYNKQGGTIDIVLKDSVLKIKDSGIGIEKESINKVFNRYYRATTQEGGFGLGLSIVKQICNRYNIKIDVESKEEEGTTFIFNFAH